MTAMLRVRMQVHRPAICNGNLPVNVLPLIWRPAGKGETA
jgi:hypothetical protein